MTTTAKRRLAAIDVTGGRRGDDSELTESRADPSDVVLDDSKGHVAADEM